MRYSVNVSILFTEVPFQERFARARDAGFTAVELWWPRGEDLDATRAAIEEAGVDVVLLNFDAGDMPAGDRGLISDPARRAAFRENVPVALELARTVGCTKLNALAGHELTELEREEQLELARENVRYRGRRRRRAGRRGADRGRQHDRERPLPALAHRAGRRVRAQRRARQTCGSSTTRTTCSAWRGTWWRRSSATSTRSRTCRSPTARAAAQPGTGEINFDYVLGRLDELGYDGYVGLEYKAARRRHGGEPGRGCRASCAAAAPRPREERAVAERIGFIGLGVMGAPMARNLIDGGPLAGRAQPQPRARRRARGRRAPSAPAARARSPSAPTW